MPVIIFNRGFDKTPQVYYAFRFLNFDNCRRELEQQQILFELIPKTTYERPISNGLPVHLKYPMISAMHFVFCISISVGENSNSNNWNFMEAQFRMLGLMLL
jgi:hypothetical protein